MLSLPRYSRLFTSPMPLLKGNPIAKRIHTQTAQSVEAYTQKTGQAPLLAVLIVGDDKPSHTYVRKKGEAAEQLGIAFAKYALPPETTEEDVIHKLQEIQNNTQVSGLIVQLPLPKHINTNNVLAAIHPKYDIDCLTAENLGRLVLNDTTLFPPTPAAVIACINETNIDMAGKKVVIIGVGMLVGKPLAIMLMNKRATVRTVNSATPDVTALCRNADIIVTGVGKKDLLRGDMVTEGTVVIDTGVDFEDGKMYGDVNVNDMLEKNITVTPTPGGVGPITVAKLLENVMICAEYNSFPII